MLLSQKYGKNLHVNYSPFGTALYGRNWSSEKYRYGFQGQEKDDEVSGAGNSYTAEFWQYDNRLARRWNQDPKAIVSISPYATFAGNPIFYSDLFGDTIKPINGYEKTDEYKMWSESSAGKKFLKDYGIGGKYEHINIEIGESMGGIEDLGDGVTIPYVVSSVDGKRREFISNDEYASFEKRFKEGKTDPFGRELDDFTNVLNKEDKLVFRIALNTNVSDTRERGMNILHEQQHVKIFHHDILTNGRKTYGSAAHHQIMLNNRTQSSYYTKKIGSKWVMPNGNGISDFNAQRWQYLYQYRREGETDEFRDKKAYDYGISNLRRLGK